MSFSRVDEDAIKVTVASPKRDFSFTVSQRQRDRPRIEIWIWVSALSGRGERAASRSQKGVASSPRAPLWRAVPLPPATGERACITP